jgi:predicted transcriptional regulator
VNPNNELCVGLTCLIRPLKWCYLLTLGAAMKTSAIEKPRSPGTVTIKLDPPDRDRIASLAAMKKRTPHYLMKEAILEYVQREEARQNFIKVADASFEHYKETGLHITLDEFSAWVDDVQKNPDAPITACHT